MMLRVTNYAARKAFKTIASSSNANYVFAARLQSPQMKIVRYFSEEKHEKVKDEPFLDTSIVQERVIEVIKNFEKVNKDKVSPLARFKDDLDLDSLDAVEVVMAIEEEFCIEIPDSEAEKILSVADAVAYVSNHPMAK